jgi:hypothetical protein
MSTKAVILAVIGVACVAAAGAGGYMALRQNSADRAPDAVLATAALTPGTATPATPADGPATAAEAAAKTSFRPVKPAEPPARPGRTALPTPASVEPKGAGTPPPTPPVTTDPPVTDPVLPPPTPVNDAPPPPPDPPKTRFEELTVKEESVIGVRLDAAISSASAKVEDKVTARVTRDVTVGGRIAIPAGTRLEGVITSVERGGKFKTPGKLGIRFTTLVLADNSPVAITTEPFSRTAESPGNEATSKIGASAVVGGLLGALIGGKKGAAIGAGAGAAGGTAAVAASAPNDIILPAGAAMTVKLTAPVTLLIERDQQ